jgi:predicted DNA-binding ribbon-helix-helix protein
MLSAVVKRSIVVDGHKTSVSLEDSFWNALKEIARGSELTLSGLVSKIDSGRANGNLSSTLRVFVLHHFRGGQPNGHGQPIADQGAGLARY